MKQSIETTKHEFVEYVPDVLEEGTLYVSMGYATVSHKCCCGCGQEVVTPLSPTDWSLIYDGKTISLDPSIGNWGFDCESHYWIRNGRVHWAPKWSKEDVASGRAADQRRKRHFFNESQSVLSAPPQLIAAAPRSKQNEGLWSKLQKLWKRK